MLCRCCEHSQEDLTDVRGAEETGENIVQHNLFGPRREEGPDKHNSRVDDVPLLHLPETAPSELADPGDGATAQPVFPPETMRASSEQPGSEQAGADATPYPPQSTREDGRPEGGLTDKSVLLEGERLADVVFESLAAAPSPTIEASIYWVRTLIDGLCVTGCVERSVFDRGTRELIVELKGVCRGEIATRSRVPIVWRVGSDERPQLRLKFSLVEGGAVEVLIEGLCCEPPSGSDEFYKRLCQAWADAGIEDTAAALENMTGIQRLSSITWAEWRACKDDLHGTKAWKIIESLVGVAAVRAVGTQEGFAGFMMGVAFVPHQRLTALRFSPLFGRRNNPVTSEGKLDSAKQDADNGKDSGVQVIGKTEMFSADEASLVVEHIKNDLGLRVIRNVFNSQPHTVHYADHFSPSSMHWARLVGNVTDLGWGGADPYRLAKLVQAGLHPRGASMIDRRLKGALSWQGDDQTYSMTGKSEGRVLWSPPAQTRQ